VGGGEKAPFRFWPSFGVKGFLFELFRLIAQKLGELDPFTRITARRSKLVLVTSKDTYKAVERLGARNIEIFPQVGLSQDQIETLSLPKSKRAAPFTFVSIARPIPWKGIEYGLRAFELADIGDANYIVLSKGKGIARIKKIIDGSKKRSQIRLIEGVDSLDEVYAILRESDVLVHLAFHEAFGNVVLEAAVADVPSICLDGGGPESLAKKFNGYIIDKTIDTPLLKAVAYLMKESCRDRKAVDVDIVKEEFRWEVLANKILIDYYKLLDE